MNPPKPSGASNAPSSLPEQRSWQLILAHLMEARVLGPLVGAVATALAIFAIHAISVHIHLHDVRADLLATPAGAMGKALALTAFGFCALATPSLWNTRLSRGFRPSPFFDPTRLKNAAIP